MTPEAVVQAQLEAYNSCDLEAFAATYARDIQILDGAGEKICTGVAELREIYGPMFEANPHQIAVILSRITGGDWVIDDEEIIGRVDNVKRHAVAIYRVRDDRISQVRLIRK